MLKSGSSIKFRLGKEPFYLMLDKIQCCMVFYLIYILSITCITPDKGIRHK